MKIKKVIIMIVKSLIALFGFLWALMFTVTGLMFLPSVINLVTEYIIKNQAFISPQVMIFPRLIPVWYLITVIIIAVIVGMRSLKVFERDESL